MSDKALRLWATLCSWKAAVMTDKVARLWADVLNLTAIFLVAFAVPYVPWTWLQLIMVGFVLLLTAAYTGRPYDKRKKDTDERV